MEAQLAQLRTLRDEIRVDVHLAGMEARKHWRELEPAMRDAEVLVDDVTARARDTVEQLVVLARTLRDNVRRHVEAQHRAAPH
jgi:hypothetical protein